jgi:hypothetical protein
MKEVQKASQEKKMTMTERSTTNAIANKKLDHTLFDLEPNHLLER